MNETRVYLVPVKVIEIGRVVRVQAECKADAFGKARNGHWLDASDPIRCIISVAGPCEPERTT